MPSASVYAIAQTPDGYLWLGTADGLVRFDGFGFVQIPLSEDDSVAFGRVLALATDADGTLWIGTESGKLVRLQAQHFRVVQVGDAITGIHPEPQAGIDVLTTHRVYRFSPAEMQLLAQCDVTPAKDNPCTQPFLPSLSAAALAGSHLRGAQVVMSIRDREHGVWLASKDHGVFRVLDSEAGKPPRVEKIGVSQGLSSDAVRVLFLDREGNIWVGTSNGLNRVRWNKFSTVTQESGLLSSNPTAVAADGDSVWAGSDLGLNRIDARDGVSTVLHDKVLSLAPDGHTGVLAGTSRGIVTLEQNHVLLLRTGVHASHVTSLAAEPDGTLFFYDTALGLFRKARGMQAKGIPLPLEHGVVTAMQADGEHGLWLSFASGMIAHSDGYTVQRFGDVDGPSTGTPHFLSLDPESGLWIASEGGLSLLAGKKRQTWSKKNGLPGNRVLWAIRGSDGRLWLGFNLGVAAINLDELRHAATDAAYRMHFDLYGEGDGLVSSPELQGNHPVATATDGRLWFITGEGLGVADPAHRTMNTTPPLPGVVALTADDRNVPITGATRLPQRTRRIEIGYTAISLSNPPKVRFRFRLMNFDEAWHDAAGSRVATYTNLPPGQYRFQVMASNEDGVWSLHPGELSFALPPAFYQTRWFAALCILALLLSILLLIRRRVRIATERVRLLFEERAKERARLAQDLHDNLIQDMVGISLQLEIANELIPSEAPGKPVIARALSLTEQSMSQGRRALTSLRATDLTQQEAFESITQVAQRYPAPVRLQAHLIRNGHARMLRGHIADEIVFIAREAVANGMQHTTATVNLQMEQTAYALDLQVWDAGSGEVGGSVRSGVRNHYGLVGMRERAARIGAHLSVEFSVAAGTRVHLHVPGEIAFCDAGTLVQRVRQGIDRLLHSTSARKGRP